MDENTILEKVKASVVDALGVDEEEVKPNSVLFDDLGAESLDLLDIVFRLEKAFGTPAREWLMRQLDYELAEVMRRAKKIKVEPFRASTTESGGTHERRRD